MRIFERGWLSANNIGFLGRDETAIVDTGYVLHVTQTEALVAHALAGRPLDRIVNTHLHSDHCGGNAALQARYPQVHTTIPVAEAAKVRAWDDDALSYVATGQQCPRFALDATMAPGDVLRLGDLDWDVLGAPGHDPHSMVLYSAQTRILISADALWENGFGVIFPELEGESGFAETRATLDVIAGLDVGLVIPGHGAPFVDVGRALDTAYRRADYLAADPVRNAQNAIKVLLKFLLLERGQVNLAELPALLASIPVCERANRRFLQMAPVALAEWATAQLVRAAAAQIDGPLLRNAI
jgi:glyoxylase-like metal-dependent hydrolase (beta-lactamase superfamily II)